MCHIFVSVYVSIYVVLYVTVIFMYECVYVCMQVCMNVFVYVRGSNCPGTSGTLPEFQSKNLSHTETLISLLLSRKLCVAHELSSKHCYLHWHQTV